MINKLNVTHPTKDIKSSLLGASGASLNSSDLQMINSFADLLEKCFILNPEKRLTWKEASYHPFIKNI